jgi:hypothetical protein
MRGGPGLSVLAAVVAMVVAVAGAGRAWGQARYEVRAEVGAEYDSNPGRTEEVQGGMAGAAIEGAPLGRLVVGGDLAARLGERQALSLSLGGAGKRFSARARADDVLVAQAAAAWNVRVGAGTAIALAGTYYDVVQRPSLEARDFRSLAPALRLDQALGPGQLTVGGGYRWFTYKPERDFDFQGPTVMALYHQLIPAEGTGVADWEWAAGVNGELRAFTGIRCVSLDACPAPPTAGARRDQFWMAHLEATRTSSFLAGAGLAVDGNLSNSYAETVVRGILHLRAVVTLPAGVVLSARAELVAAWYREPVPLSRPLVPGAPQASIEDERRTTLRAEAVRPLSPNVDVGIRYGLYTNELAAGPVRFRRQTLLLFVAVGYPGGS